jgi:hypothetical protein
MEPTVPDTSPSLNAESIMTIVHAAASTLAKTAEHQAGAVRVQSDANVRIAEIQATSQQELARINGGTHRLALIVTGVVVVILMLAITGLLVASFFAGHVEIATHVIAVIGGAVPAGIAAWFAGKAKRP